MLAPRQKLLFFIIVKSLLRRKISYNKKKKRQYLNLLRGLKQRFFGIATGGITILILSKVQRSVWAFEREEKWFQNLYENVLNPECEKYWKMNFRVSGETFLKIIDLVRDRMEKRDTNFRKAIPLEKRVAIALWRLSSGNSFRATSITFAVGKSTSVQIGREFCDTIAHLAKHFIKFPKSRREVAQAMRDFKKDYSCKIPQTVGVIDATHIRIMGPNCESKADYFCRKQHYSINTQAITGANLIFYGVATGFPGSVHDSRILRNTTVFQKAVRREILVAPEDIVENVRVRPIILGDGGYPLSTWLLRPYNFGLNLSPQQKLFNRALSSSRSSVERSFGILKARWRCLLKRLDSNLENISHVIITCVVLHNICQSNKDFYEDDDGLLEEIIRHERQARLRRRQNNAARPQDAEVVREAIKNHVYQNR